MERTRISGELGRKLETFVADLVASGRYKSKSKVLREGIRVIQEREARLAILDQALGGRLADLREGRTKPLVDVIARLEAKYTGMGDRSE